MIRYILAFTLGIVIFTQPVFFSTLGIFGLEYMGNSTSYSYIFYLSATFSITAVLYTFATIKFGISKVESIILAVIGLYFIIHLIWALIIGTFEAFLPEYFVLFLILGLPGILSALCVVKVGLVREVIQTSQIHIFLIALGISLFSVIPSLSGNKVVSLAGATYQSLSYFSALSFGMLLFFNFQVSYRERLPFFSHPIVKAITTILVVTMMVACVLAGGRGAFLLLLAYVLLFLFKTANNSKKQQDSTRKLRFYLKVGIFFCLLITFAFFIDSNEDIKQGISRATAFIGSDGTIDLDKGASGRGLVYAQVFGFIDRSPILGYGPFSFYDQTIRPHNIFLEFWLQFGLFGFIFSLIFIFRFTYRLLFSRGVTNLWLLTIFAYPLFLLMFSGSYLHSSTFLFCITFYLVSSQGRNLCRNSIHGT